MAIDESTLTKGQFGTLTAMYKGAIQTHWLTERKVGSA